MNNKKSMWQITIWLSMGIFIADMIFKSYILTYFPNEQSFSMIAPLIFSLILIAGYGIICFYQIKEKTWAIITGLTALGILSFASLIKSYDILWTNKNILNSLSAYPAADSDSVGGIIGYIFSIPIASVIGFIFFALELGIMLYMRKIYYSRHI